MRAIKPLIVSLNITMTFRESFRVPRIEINEVNLSLSLSLSIVQDDAVLNSYKMAVAAGRLANSPKTDVRRIR